MIDFTSEHVSNSTVVVKVHGDLDRMSRNYFFDCVSDQFSSDVKHIVIDCSGLGTVSNSRVLTMLASRMRTRRRGQKVYFTHLSSSLSNVIQAAKLNMPFVIYGTTQGLVDNLFAKETPRFESPITTLTS